MSETDSAPLAVVLIVIFLFSVWALVYVPKLQLKSLIKKPTGEEEEAEFATQKERLKLEDDIRKTTAQIIGGALLLLGLFFTYQTINLNNDTLSLNREGQVTDRYIKAIGQINSNNDRTTRLGGLYSLERISKDSAKDYKTVIKVLCAYIRENSPNTSGEQIKKNSDRDGSPDAPKVVSIDIQTALTVISERDTTTENEYGLVIDLRKSYLHKAEIPRASFSYANLSESNLSEANLSSADFTNADFTNADFTGAIVKGAIFDGAKISIVKGLTLTQLESALIDERTELPLEFKGHQKRLVNNSKQRETRNILERYNRQTENLNRQSKFPE